MRSTASFDGITVLSGNASARGGLLGSRRFSRARARPRSAAGGDAEPRIACWSAT